MYNATIYLNTTKGKTQYNFAFDYINKTYVKVKLGNKELEYDKEYTVADKTVTLKVIPQEKQTLLVYRKTPTNKQVEWYDSSIMRAKDLNLFNVQILHINEEAQDKLIDTGLSEDLNDNKWDARDKPIKNVGNPTTENEVVTLGYFNSIQAGYIQQSQALAHIATEKAEEATRQATASAVSARSAKQAENEAKQYAELAKASEGTAKEHMQEVERDRLEVRTNKSAVEETLAQAKALDKKFAEGNSTINQKVAIVEQKATEVTKTKEEFDSSMVEVKEVKGLATQVLSKVDEVNTKHKETLEVNENINSKQLLIDRTKRDIEALTLRTESANANVISKEANVEANVSKAEKAQREATTQATLAKQYAEQTKDSKEKSEEAERHSLVAKRYAEQAKESEKQSKIHLQGSTVAQQTTQENKEEVTKLTAQVLEAQQKVITTSAEVAQKEQQVGVSVAKASKAESTATEQAQLAKKYAEQAKESAGGDFLTRTEAKDLATKAELNTKAPKGNYATVEYVEGAVSNIVKKAPEMLNTLEELATALNNDPNFATTITGLLSKKANANEVYIKSYIDKELGDRPKNADIKRTYVEKAELQREIQNIDLSNYEKKGTAYSKSESDGKYLARSGTALKAITANKADTATTAQLAKTATKADVADRATKADTADIAERTRSATSARHAQMADADGEGNNIVDTYIKRSELPKEVLWGDIKDKPSLEAYVKKAGDTMTGTLIVTEIKFKNGAVLRVED